MGVAQGDLRAVSNLQRLTFGDGSQTSLALQICVKISSVKKQTIYAYLETGLESRSHDAVVRPSLVQNGKVDIESGQVEHKSHSRDDQQSNNGLTDERGHREAFIGNQPPHVLPDDVQTQYQRAHAHKFDAKHLPIMIMISLKDFVKIYQTAAVNDKIPTASHKNHVKQ